MRISLPTIALETSPKPQKIRQVFASVIFKKFVLGLRFFVS